MDYQMFLDVAGDRHRIKEGVTLVGMAENDRFSVIRLQNESICPKHAALRYVATTRELHIMDLCSHGGTYLFGENIRSTKQMPPLEWHKVSIGDKFRIGTVDCRPELTVGMHKSNGSSFYADEESTDFIDCSLEEPLPQKSRLEPKKLQQSGTSCAGSIQEPNVSSSLSMKNASVRRSSSFFIPETQQLSERCSPSLNGSVTTLINETKEEDRVVGNYADDDDLFFIPETQDCSERAGKSPHIEPTGTTIGEGNKEDDFLKFETEDDENTGDGIFNNPYVEQSQNLLQNINNSYKKDAADTQRKSILPDRSVDSISFHGHLPVANETNDDLSKIEWNETNTTKNTATDIDREQSGSVTPELIFDQPVTTKKAIFDNKSTVEHREESVTPELDFDRVTPQSREPINTNKLSLKKDASVKKAANKRQSRETSVTPDLNFEQDEAEISLNQEGANNHAEKEVDPYEMATQIMADDDVAEEPDDDPYLAPTQALSTAAHPTESASTSIYELQTQVAPDVQNRESPTFKVPSLSAYDVLTQKMPAKEIKKAHSLRKVFVKLDDLKQEKKNVSLRVNKEIELDPFEIGTQPISTKKEDRIYDLETQALDDLDDTVPFDTLAALLREHPKDAYELLTQPLTAHHSAGSLEDEDPEMTKNFRPPVNSTCRLSVLLKQIDDQPSAEADGSNISPSSNKENRAQANQRSKTSAIGGKRKTSASVSKSETKRSPDTTDQRSVDEQLDEEYCLAETMPVADKSSSKSSNDTSGKKTRSTKKEKVSEVRFKKPDSVSNATSTSKRSTASTETPQSKPNSEADTSSFDFNTPEHPFLDIAKKEKILAVSDMIKRRSTASESAVRKNKYLFGDSSDEDNEPDALVFQKRDSKIQMMKYDKDKDKPPKEFAPLEPRASRERKRNKRYSRDEEEKSKSGEPTRTSVRNAKTKSHTIVDNPMKSRVDESVDYQPNKFEEKSTKTRKRKATTEELPEPFSEAPRSSKSKKKDESTLKKTRPPPTKSEELADSKRPSRSKRTTATEDVIEIKNSRTTKKTESAEKTTNRKATRVQTKRRTSAIDISSDEEDPQTASSATEATSVTSDSQSSGTRKSSRNSKPRLMFTKLSPEPYKRMITRFGAKKR
ncbi:uncharacterized protein LOC129771578 isoform X2 [Toxorhynchites rutilus septentrionalis]|uniref:uncharacterized protein LOC129771578 isoform X2 n=1 Tax=Toxorhynchites rutilus septentrionalis TaxID=329112 RepID=UPI002479D995|nr:uncharacterized protein LOC129771578 isoform X2 [Toxorhynchites rutilus septentrionalis]